MYYVYTISTWTIIHPISSSMGNICSLIQDSNPHRDSYPNHYDIERKTHIISTKKYLECFTLFKYFINVSRNQINNINESFVENIDIIIRFINENINNITPICGTINLQLFQCHEYHLSAIDSVTWLEKFFDNNPNFIVNNVNVTETYYSDKKNMPKNLKIDFEKTKKAFRVLEPKDVIELHDVLKSVRFARKYSAVTTCTSLFYARNFADVSLRTSEKTQLHLIPNTFNTQIVDYINSNEYVGIQHVGTKKYLSYDKNIIKMLWDDKNMKTTFKMNITDYTNNVNNGNIVRELRNNDYVKFQCIDNKYIYLPSIYNYDRYTWNHVKAGNASSNGGKLCEVFVVKLV